MKLPRILFTALIVIGAAMFSVRPARAQTDFFFTSYYDVATSVSPSASGYGGGGASGGVGDGLVRIVNGGDECALPGQNGTACAMIYVFDDIEEMQACCGCPVTPDGMRTMSVINNLTKNFGVNRGNLNAGVIDIMATCPSLYLPKPVPLPPQITTLGSSGWACDPTYQYGPLIGVSESSAEELLNVRVWMTHTEGNTPVPASSKNLIKGTSLEEFYRTNILDNTEYDDLINFCLFLVQNGSGTGACSCGSGDSFSKVAGPVPH